MEVTITTHGGREDHRKIAGLEIKRVAPAIVGIAPGDFGVANTCRVHIHRAVVVVDLDLPGRTARFVHARDRSLAMLGLGADRWSGNTDHQRGSEPGQWPTQLCH